MKYITIASIVLAVAMAGLYINAKNKIANPINQCYDIVQQPVDIDRAIESGGITID